MFFPRMAGEVGPARLVIQPQRLYKYFRFHAMRLRGAVFGFVMGGSNSNNIMSPESFYARWRARGISGPALREGSAAPPPESLLQAIWQQQRLLRDQLTTLDARPVHILHPGFKNHSAGPDFRGALIQIGSEPPRSGDVEIDLQAAGWRAHGHDVNPAFQNVILHVIWEGDRAVAEGRPTVALHGRLDSPLAELDAALGRDSIGSLPEEMRGKCCAPLRELPPEKLPQLLHQAAEIRWRGKAAQLQARARQAGWEQALWEGLFRALGYKQNTWPMQRLAELRPHWSPTPGDTIACQARLFGLSHLLPGELTRAHGTTDAYLKGVWDRWWRERDQFSENILPRESWRFSGLRPANHPQRRLALAAHWAAAGNLPQKLEQWIIDSVPDAELADSLLRILQVEQDEFWSWHWTFRSARLPRPQPMLGVARVTDLAINVILAWLWMRAVDGRNESLRRAAEHRYLAWPSAEDNSVLRLARERLLGGAKPGILRGAGAQQGLLQILRDFCEHSNALCDHCAFPELVRNYAL